MSPATSVIIPCYNGEQYLPDALASVRAQTVPVCEIIVVDDGSFVPLQAPPGWDGPPLRIIRTENRGLAAARNLGVRHARGAYLAFLDADDFWAPEKVERQERALDADPRAVASFTRCVDAPGFFGFGPYPPADSCDADFLLVLWYNLFFPPSAVMVRRGALEQVGLFREDLGNGEDIELWLRLLEHGRFAQVPAPLTWYRQHPGQFTKNLAKKMFGDKRAREAMIAAHPGLLDRAGIRPEKAWDAYRNDILLVYYRREFATARRLLWDFWRDHPLDLAVLARAIVALLPSRLVTWLRGRLDDRAGELSGGQSHSEVSWHLALRRARHAIAR